MANPETDWKIIFLSTIILIIIALALSIFVFVKIDKGEIFVQGSADRAGQTLDISLLRDTVSYYEDKAAEFERIKSEKPSAVDPSI